MLIALEGIDTSGKSTQINLLRQAFPHAIFTKEPGGTPLGQTLREALLHQELAPSVQFLLFLTDRALHLEQVIKPHVHKLIFSDRSLVSGLAYAPYSLEEALELHRRHGLLEILPDVIFLLKLERTTLQQRWQAKNANTHIDGIESMGVGFLKRTQERLVQACQMLELKTHILDASKSPKSIHQDILETLAAPNT